MNPKEGQNIASLLSHLSEAFFCVFFFCRLQVRYLKIIEKSGYQALPWVRYITQSGGEKTSTLWREFQQKK